MTSVSGFALLSSVRQNALSSQITALNVEPLGLASVGILALHYQVLATIVGVAASFVIAGLFPQSRSLFVIGFAGWLGLCVYVGGLPVAACVPMLRRCSSSARQMPQRSALPLTGVASYRPLSSCAGCSPPSPIMCRRGSAHGLLRAGSRYR
jgi:hypothetical protein